MEPLMTAVIPVLIARDVQASLAFYAGLGFAVDFKDDDASPRYAGVSRDGVALHLQWQDAAHWANALDRPVYRFRVADVAKAYAEFDASGAMASNAASTSPWRMPAHTPWGTFEFHLRDPDGNGLQFFQPA